MADCPRCTENGVFHKRMVDRGSHLYCVNCGYVQAV